MRKLILIILGLMQCWQIQAQVPANLDGTWKGICYQEQRDSKAVKGEYYFTLHLVKTGKTTFEGTSIIEFIDDPKTFGLIQFTAEWKNNRLAVQEFKIKEEQGTTYFSWCIKKYDLALTMKGKEMELQGLWTGQANGSTCNPGSIRIKKAVPQQIQHFETQNKVVVPQITNQNFDAQVKAQERQTFILKNIHFQPNKTEITPDSHAELAKLAEFLNKNSNLQVRINGHTDKGSTMEFNQKLSEGRALAVKNYLVMKGVTGNRISTAGFGGTKPIADNETIDGRALNRRVELEILGYEK